MAHAREGTHSIAIFLPHSPGTEDDAIQSDQAEPAPVKAPAPTKPNPGLAPNVVSDLKQLDGGQQIEKVPAEEGNSIVGENLNIGRLGMGGLKALEKINNLIKASAETQDGDDPGQENSLTDEQAQAIERMIIEGIHHIKKKPPPPAGTQRASIPRQKNNQKPFPKLPQAVRRKGPPMSFPSKLEAQRKDPRAVPTPVQVGVPRLQKEGPNGKSNQNEEKKTVNESKGSSLNEPVRGPAKMRPIPVLKSQPADERKKSQPGKLRGLGLGNAGAGNSP